MRDRGLAQPVSGRRSSDSPRFTTDTRELERLFTGDHLAWSPEQQHSLRTLTEHRFSWVLPAHGRRVKLAAPEMAAALDACLAWMATV